MKRTIAIVIALIAVSACTPGYQGNTCDDPCPEAEKQNPWNYACYNSGKNIFNAPEDELLPPRDYGNGFYYFPGAQKRFAESISLFLRNHSELEVAAITNDQHTGHSPTSLGYFVFFRTKSQGN